MSYILDALKKSEQMRGDSTIPAAVTATITRPTPAKRRFVLPLMMLITALAAGWFIAQPNRADPHQSPTPASGPVILPPVLLSSDAPLQVTSPYASPLQISPPSPPNQQPTAVESRPSAPIQNAARITPSPHNHAMLKQPATATTTILTEHHASPSDSQPDPIPVFKPITHTSSVSRITGSLPDVPTQAQAAPAEANILAISELPLSVQQALPAIHIEGHIYDDNPTARMVIINGGTYRQKQRIAGGLILEEITPKGVILNYQGHVFHMGVFE